ncbi:alpha/beta hydrolase family protein [Novosphingobium sp. Leaf2]|uniref:alpha/beta hydrolase family protein n=1 Tax=Novosphingobium sp. Leaf2 TaxID=1735670 RepID=UPI0006FD1228|nr:alpha/beta fold hydrolase [Novosphingobium sp. Leaf2]KQM20400.1 lysophospholipase [Novosphingobium sp. Leaf2]
MTGGNGLGRREVLLGGAAFAVAMTGGRALAAAIPGRVMLQTPEGRAISVTEWRPAGRPRGIILFSHGAGSSPSFYGRIVDPWVAAGWHVLAPLHVDSREHPDLAKFPGLLSWKARVEDMRALIAHIGDAPFVAAGHSYGGLTATMLSGAQPVVPEGLSLPLVPRLAKAVIAFSPPPIIPALVTQQGYAQIAVPALIQTGTRDLVAGLTTQGPDGWNVHLAAFEAPAPGGNRYGLVLEGADHYFGGAICDSTKPGPMQLAPLELANARVALFLEGYGASNVRARRRLDSLVTQALPARLMKR